MDNGGKGKRSPSRKVVAIVLIVFFFVLFAIYEAGLWISFLAQLGIIPPIFYERRSASPSEPLEPVMWEKPEYIVKVNSTYWEVLEGKLRSTCSPLELSEEEREVATNLRRRLFIEIYGEPKEEERLRSIDSTT